MRGLLTSDAQVSCKSEVIITAYIIVVPLTRLIIKNRMYCLKVSSSAGSVHITSRKIYFDLNADDLEAIHLPDKQVMMNRSTAKQPKSEEPLP
ncbi:MAG: hypothetical protein IPG64_22080 [Haliea sp.]|nr:hypothetical protein [Haliea sp.]